MRLLLETALALFAGLMMTRVFKYLKLNFPDVTASGREEVKGAFEGVFKAYSVEAKIVKLNQNSMEYDVELAGLHIPCIGAATCNEDELITEYIVRPR